MPITGNDILQLIPQRPPMVMIDTLESCSEQGAETGFTISPTNIFCEKGIFSEGGLIENIAQTAAAQVGYLCREKGIPVPVGFIGAVRNLEITSLPKAGDRLRTSVRIENEVFGVTVITGRVFCREQLLASAEMKIVIKE